MNWNAILLEAANSVKQKVAVLAGTKEAKEVLGIGAGGDYTKKIDNVAEEAIIDVLNRHGVSCTLVSEEAGIKVLGGRSKFYVVTDPLDGTTNAIHGVDFYATSIAVSDKPTLDGVFYGFVMDLKTGTVFEAEKGGGAFYQGKAIRVSDETAIKECIIGIDLNGVDENLLGRMTPVIAAFRHLRHFGANALEICYVASGLTNAFIDLRDKIRVTDVAAGYLILKEAGGVMLNLEGKELNISLTPKACLSFVAGNQKICKIILDKLND